MAIKRYTKETLAIPALMVAFKVDMGATLPVQTGGGMQVTGGAMFIMGEVEDVKDEAGLERLMQVRKFIKLRLAREKMSTLEPSKALKDAEGRSTLEVQVTPTYVAVDRIISWSPVEGTAREEDLVLEPMGPSSPVPQKEEMAQPSRHYDGPEEVD